MIEGDYWQTTANATGYFEAIAKHAAGNGQPFTIELAREKLEKGVLTLTEHFKTRLQKHNSRKYELISEEFKQKHIKPIDAIIERLNQAIQDNERPQVLYRIYHLISLFNNKILGRGSVIPLFEQILAVEDLKEIPPPDRESGKIPIAKKANMDNWIIQLEQDYKGTDAIMGLLRLVTSGRFNKREFYKTAKEHLLPIPTFTEYQQTTAIRFDKITATPLPIRIALRAEAIDRLIIKINKQIEQEESLDEIAATVRKIHFLRNPEEAVKNGLYLEGFHNPEPKKYNLNLQNYKPLL